MTLVFLRGATSYELQVGRFIVRVCHLRVASWRWRPWLRVQVEWDRT